MSAHGKRGDLAGEVPALTFPCLLKIAMIDRGIFPYYNVLTIPSLLHCAYYAQITTTSLLQRAESLRVLMFTILHACEEENKTTMHSPS